MNDPMIADRDSFYAEEECKMARRDEVERQAIQFERTLHIRYTSAFHGEKELHSADIVDAEGEDIAHIPSNDSLEDVIVIARSKRENIAHEMAEKAVKDAEQNQ